jgi:flagellar hook capping protein FlgD
LRCDQVAGGWRIQYTGDHPEKARVQVFNVAGKMLARFDAPFDESNSFTWDGRDAEGRRLANGIYFLRVTGTAGAAKAVLIR